MKEEQLSSAIVVVCLLTMLMIGSCCIRRIYCDWSDCEEKCKKEIVAKGGVST